MYAAREEEYALFEARSRAKMILEKVAAKMGTIQTAIASLEGGSSMLSL